MEKDAFEKKYWQEIDSKILLANIANQCNAGIVGKPKQKIFAQHLAAASTGSSCAKDILSSTGKTPYKLEDFFFCSPFQPKDTSGYLFVRVAPLSSILKSVNIVGGMESKLEERLNVFSNTSSHPSEIARAKRDIEVAFEKPKFEDFEGDWDDSLEGYCDNILEATLRSNVGVGLEPSKVRKPKFTTYLSKTSRQYNPATLPLNGASTLNLADYFRDILGLDFLTREYKDKKTVMGFLVFQSDQTTKHKIKRPTAFDITSDFRFRGVSPKDEPSPSDWGETVDLSKLYKAYKNGTNPSIIGTAEVILDNPTLDAGSKILVGYLGPVSLPRNDTNDLDSAKHATDYRMMQGMHNTFLEQYLSCPNCDTPFLVLNP